MKKFLLTFALLLIPGLSHAQDFDNVQDLLGGVQNILELLVPILIGIAVIIFIWGVVQFVARAGDDEKRKEGRKKMVWGIVGLVVIVAVWGLVNFVIGALDLDDEINQDVPIPRVPDSGDRNDF